MGGKQKTSYHRTSGVRSSFDGFFPLVNTSGDQYAREDRDRTSQCLRERGVGCSDYFQPIHLQPFYRELLGTKEGDFPITEGIASRTIALPFHNNLTEEEIEYVVSNLDDIMK